MATFLGCFQWKFKLRSSQRHDRIRSSPRDIQRIARHCLSQKAQDLELAFHSKELRTICESESEATTTFGVALAEVLKHRLADIRAASSVRDLLVGRPSVVEGTEDREMSVDLNEGYRLVFGANHTQNPVKKSNKVDWTRVSRIKILRIEKNDA
jgi:plasmid maintenance system killer protein